MDTQSDLEPSPAVEVSEEKSEAKTETKIKTAPILSLPSICILLCDESKSMGSMTGPFVDAVNSFMDVQRNSSICESDLCEVICFTGDDSCTDKGRFVRSVFPMNLLSAMPKFTREYYNPRKRSGGTPLQSVICDTLDSYREMKRVVVVVFTDGDQSTTTKNCVKHSVEATQASVRAALARGWEIILVGPNPEFAKTVGIPVFHHMKINDVHSMHSAMSQAALSSSSSRSAMSSTCEPMHYKTPILLSPPSCAVPEIKQHHVIATPSS